MPAYKLVIFDWDGTLMDSVAHIVDSMQQAAYVLGEPVPSIVSGASYYWFRLARSDSYVISLSQSCGARSDSAAICATFCWVALLKVSYLQGAEPLLTQLTQQGYLLAVATGKSRLGLESGVGTNGHWVIILWQHVVPMKQPLNRIL
jgi:phosphoglycolate phosphatase